MGFRKVTVKQSVADNIAKIAWFIESKGMLVTAEKFSDDAYDFIIKLADDRKSYPACREPSRMIFGYKCVSYKKKFTIVFIETEEELIIVEFIPSKMIHW